jgi:predicted small integral membrane protein
MLARLGGLRAALAVLTATTGVYMALVVFNNITDFDTNRAFVVHVLAMDTTFKSPDTMWRAIASPGLALTAYILIIAWEAVAAVALLAGFVAWLRGGPAKQLTNVGLLMMVLLFGLGFIVIGGEWFQMWQSHDWNGLQPALQNFLIASVALILNHLPERQRTT